MITNNGIISLCFHRPGLRSHGKIFQKLKLEEKNYQLLSLYFILNKSLKYDIKATEYSVIYRISKEALEKILKTNPYNYQYFLMLREKDKFNRSEFEVFKCEVCEKEMHSFYHCPKLHFLPISQIVIENHKKKKREERVRFKSLKNIKKIQKNKKKKR